MFYLKNLIDIFVKSKLKIIEEHFLILQTNIPKK